MEYIVDVQGFKEPANRFVLKELAIIAVGGARPSVFFFKPPYAWDKLPTKYKLMNAWCTRNHHGLDWDLGYVPYFEAREIIGTKMRAAKAVYVKGAEKICWLKDLVGGEVVVEVVLDLGDFGCPSLRTLPSTPSYKCFAHAYTRTEICARENVLKMYDWFEERM